tara:strand:+ start:80046 stop:80597 length:552 start_codon:yes stop_codon:yes gene_type:complete
MKKTFILFVLIICFSSFQSYAQELVNAQKQKSDFWQHVQFGGGVGLSFGSEFFSGTLAPSAVYRFNQKFATGVGLNMTYNSQKYVYESYVLGTSILGLFNVIPQLQLSAEFEQLYVNRSFKDNIIVVGCNTSDCDQSYWYPGLYLGAGFSTGPVTMGIRFDVIYDSEKSIYGNAYNPFVRFYF